ncbi:MAG: hypothetical protein DMD55_17075, partial [Gemmatimonadetes bacterium]
MVTAEAVAARRAEIAQAPDLTALLARLTERAAPLLERRPIVPPLKALLSSDGGICPDDGTALLFDPWSPNQHHCSRCGKTWAGERHDRHWARFQHLWLAERAAHLAALQALGGSDAAGVRAAEILRAYARSYWQYPNRDNVLGPSRLFFSTYLESIWILNYLAAAMLLRESGHLDEATSRGVGQVADEAANLIGEFDEGFSNRQTWNDAALAAIAVWFEDDDLAKRAIEGETGLLAHLMRGFGRDGMWYEGENYHLFALRGLLTGAAWARAAGVDLGAEPALAARVRAALLAPALTALPDLTFPARKDSRFGVSLAQPMYLELWEIGLATCGMRDAGTGMRDVASWLQALYRVPGVVPEVFDSYLHDAPVERIPHPASRISLSWWSLLEMLPELPSDAPPWVPGSALLDSQGLAVLRAGERYVSLECGPLGGGHGHPDRLHLTLHADGVHWLPDVGTGSYVARDLLWYRSTLAHNAPRLDGASRGGNAMCETFDAPGDWGWTRGRNGDVTRTVVAGPAYLLDIVELASREDHLLELPWHFQGRGDVVTRGRWEDAELQDEFTSRAQRFAPETKGPITLELAADSRPLTALFLLEGELLRAEGPGLPGSGTRAPFYLLRARGRSVRFVTVLEPIGAAAFVRGVGVKGSVIEVETTSGVDRHSPSPLGWEVTAPARRVRLSGARDPEPPFQPLIELDLPQPAVGAALRVDRPPALDGTGDGFDTSEPLRLELEDQYRRSEEPYSGPEDFSAIAHVGWDDEALYLAVEVTKPDLCFRAAAAPPLRLDNEPDDIHSDGVQLYLRDLEGGDVSGFLVVPEVEGGRLDGGGVRVRGAGESPGAPRSVHGAWRRTEQGYRITLAVAWPEWQRAHVGGQVGFDLIINEMLPGRERRAG